MNPSALKFVLPTTLVVTTFAIAGACTSTPDDGATTTQAESTDNADTSTQAEGTGDPMYCGDIADMTACAELEQCTWADECVHVCLLIDDQVECEAIEGCTWLPDGGGTGTGGDCLGPFT